MNKLIKMDLYRMFKSKSTWILVFIFLLASFVLEFTDLEAKHIVSNITVSAQNGNIIIIGIVYSVIISNVYIKNGYIKNLSSILSGKNNIYLIHMITAMVFYAICFMSNILLVLIVNLIKYRNINFKVGIDSIFYLIVLIILLSVFCMEICCVTLYTKSNILGIGFGLLSFMYLDDAFIELISKIIKIQFDISKLGILKNISSLQVTYKSNEYLLALISAFGYFVIIQILARIFIYKKEIY